jgi:hypothetical protein
MLAWVSGTIRARELFMRGEYEELFHVAKLFVSTKHIRFGYTSQETLGQWEKDILGFRPPQSAASD